MENSRSRAATRPQHWRLDAMRAEVAPLYRRKERPFFLVEFEQRCRHRDWEPEVPLDVAPDEFDQARRAEWIWVYAEPAAMCRSIPMLEDLDLDATEALLVSPPSLNQSDEWRCERLKAVFKLHDDGDVQASWLYLVGSGAIYASISGSWCYLEMHKAECMFFRDPRTLPGPDHRHFALPKDQSLAAVVRRAARDRMSPEMVANGARR